MCTFLQNHRIFWTIFAKQLENDIMMWEHHFRFHIRRKGIVHSYLDARQPTRIYIQLKALWFSKMCTFSSYFRSQKMCTFLENVHISDIIHISGNHKERVLWVRVIRVQKWNIWFPNNSMLQSPVTASSGLYKIGSQNTVQNPKKCAHFQKMCTFLKNVHIFQKCAHFRKSQNRRPASFEQRNLIKTPFGSCPAPEGVLGDDVHAASPNSGTVSKSLFKNWSVSAKNVHIFRKNVHISQKCAHLRIMDIRENI